VQSRCHFRPLRTTLAGIDGWGIPLASGILARNKGLNLPTLICNLTTKKALGQFEEQSVFWPRPAKTLRSLNSREFERLFFLLGPAFVTVATELALLLTDAPAGDWLDGNMRILKSSIGCTEANMRLCSSVSVRIASACVPDRRFLFMRQCAGVKASVAIIP
jgi:hypothetical protein